MFEAAFWGLIQGLTEFLPISSSGHLVLVPALLDQDQPDLAVTAVLHLGTLVAVLVYYWSDVRKMLSFRSDPDGRRILWIVLLGTIPAAVIGLAFEDRIDSLFDDPVLVAWMLIVTGVVLLASLLIKVGTRALPSGTWLDAVVVGFAQATALVPGISRSGMSVTAALGRGFTRVEAARFAFLLGIPAIAGAGLLQGWELVDEGGLTAEVWVGAIVAAVVGYLAIALFVRVLTSVGMAPFGIYCIGFGTLSLFLL
jgi:undecaprenyl-diphosphatase